MFEVDPKGKRIHTMTKSGCCWHQGSPSISWRIIILRLSVIVEDDQTTSPYETLTEQKWNGKKMVKSIEKMLKLRRYKTLYSFKIVGKERGYYSLHTTGHSIMHLSIPPEKSNSLILSKPTRKTGIYIGHLKNQLSLTFTNKSAQYRVYELPNKIGVDAVTKGVLYEQVGELPTKTGSLIDLLNLKIRESCASLKKHLL